MSAVEPIGDTQDAAQDHDRFLHGGLQGVKLGMVGLRRGLAMIAGDLRDKRHFLRCQGFPRIILDQLRGPLVMVLAVGSLRPADVVQERGAVEQFA